MKGVRSAASFALGQFAEHLQPEISEHYERVLPCIFAVLSDAEPDVQVSCLQSYWSFKVLGDVTINIPRVTAACSRQSGQ
jgi:hypothetical protein